MTKKLILNEWDLLRLRHYLDIISEEIPRLNYDRIVDIGKNIFYLLNSLSAKTTDLDTRYVIEKQLIPCSNSFRVSFAGTAPIKLRLDNFGVWTLKNKREFLSRSVRTIQKALKDVEILRQELNFFEVQMEFDKLKMHLGMRGDSFERSFHCSVLIKQIDQLSFKLLANEKLKDKPKITQKIYEFRTKAISSLTHIQTESDEKKQSDLFNLSHQMYNALQQYESLLPLSKETFAEVEMSTPEIIAKKKPVKEEKPKEEKV